MAIHLFFLGVGAANNHQLGHASCVIEFQCNPVLMIDCGHDSLERYKHAYNGALPQAIFITHLHFDHIGGLEQLFFESKFCNVQPILYVPMSLVERLTLILSHTSLAEGGLNIWTQLRIVPILDQFWHHGVLYRTYETRHHQPKSAYALHLPGQFLYTGDTRPIPEILNFHAQQGELIFHDCSVKGNPSHSGISDLLYEYSPDILSRIRVYHYRSEADVETFLSHGLKVVRSHERVELNNTNLI